MKKAIQIIVASYAAALLAGCGSCTTETHNVRIKETTYRPAPAKPSGPESFNPVERY